MFRIKSIPSDRDVQLFVLMVCLFPLSRTTVPLQLGLGVGADFSHNDTCTLGRKGIGSPGLLDLLLLAWNVYLMSKLGSVAIRTQYS